jgi:hypothetical protein
LSFVFGFYVWICRMIAAAEARRAEPPAELGVLLLQGTLVQDASSLGD